MASLKWRRSHTMGSVVRRVADGGTLASSEYFDSVGPIVEPGQVDVRDGRHQVPICCSGSDLLSVAGRLMGSPCKLDVLRV